MQEITLRNHGEPQRSPDRAKRPFGDIEARHVEAGWGIGEYWKAARAHKFVTLLLIAVGLALGYVATQAQTRMYRAHSTIELQELNDNILNRREVEPTAQLSSDTYLQTQVRILQSDSLLERVAVRLGLPERNIPVEQPGWLLKARAAAQSEAKTNPTLNDWVGAVGSKLKVRSPDQTRLVELVFDWPNPRFSAEFIASLIQEYQDEQTREREATARTTSMWLTAKLETVRRSLEDSESRLAEYAKDAKLVVTGENGDVAEAKLLQIQKEYAQAESDRITKQANFELAKSSPSTSLPEVLDNGPIKDYQLKLTDLKRQFAELKLTVLPTHYRYERMQSQIQELEEAVARERANIIKRIQNEFDAATRRERMLAATYNSHVRVLGDQSNKRIRFNLLKQETATNRLVYETMLQKVKEYSIASALRVDRLRVIDRPKVPTVPFRPNPAVNLAAGLAGGLVMALGALVLLERQKETFQSPNELSHCLRASDLGAIPRSKWLPSVDDEGKSSLLRLRKRPLTSEVDTRGWREDSLLVDSFRTALASVLFRNGSDVNPKVILITSAVGGEGKTTISRYFGRALAETRQQVLLIDADLRRPRLHMAFDIPEAPGLSDVLTGPNASEIDPCIHETGIPGLWVMPAGSKDLSLADVLYSAGWPDLLLRLREEFQTVIIDSPPMLVMPDARILGRLADGVILVVRANSTLRSSAQDAWRRLEADGLRILGTILNDWTPGRDGDQRYGYVSRYDGGRASKR